MRAIRVIRSLATALLTLWLLGGLAWAADTPPPASRSIEWQHLQIIQATLARLGWYRGQIDGHPSQALNEALKRMRPPSGGTTRSPAR